ncbi:MAG: family finger-like domain protein [Micavibrio sp.]|nr:family finger-like domain protein [Micavibrio sp.]
MILICEQCQARFLVASLLLGVDGRKVKCGVCGHTWFQPPGDEEYTPGSGGDEALSFRDHLEHEDLEPIPEGVRPIPEGSAMPVTGSHKFTIRDHLTRDNIGGGAMAAAVFAVAFVGLIAFHGPLTKIWPPFSSLFSAVGIESTAGQGLIFDQVAAKQSKDSAGKSILTLTGNIVNVRKEMADIPSVWATLQKSEKEKGVTFMVKLDKKNIDAQGKIPFAAVYDDLPDDMTQVKISFAEK